MPYLKSSGPGRLPEQRAKDLARRRDEQVQGGWASWSVPLAISPLPYLMEI